MNVEKSWKRLGLCFNARRWRARMQRDALRGKCKAAPENTYMIEADGAFAAMPHGALRTLHQKCS